MFFIKKRQIVFGVVDVDMNGIKELKSIIKMASYNKGKKNPSVSTLSASSPVGVK